VAKVSRRRLVKAAVASAILGGVASIIGVVRQSGYAPPPAPLASLSPAEYATVQHLARRVCAADAPGVVTPDETDVAGFVDAYIAKMPRRLKRDLLRFLAFIEQVAPPLTGRSSRFTRLAPEGQDAVLASLEAHSSDLLRGGFDGLKALLFMGYYRDARTWGVIGYDGPLLGRSP